MGFLLRAAVIVMIIVAIFAFVVKMFCPQDPGTSFPFSPLNPARFHPVEIRPRAPSLKVYMYDLPRRFNFGMLQQRRTETDDPVDRASLPPWPKNSGLKKQHSVEYWMTASLLADQRPGLEFEVVRVFDAAAAEVFFVPFFSSLSFNSHGHNMTDPDTMIDRRLQVETTRRRF